MRILPLLVFFAFLANAALADDRPNIVLVLADDLGWTGLGCYGSEFYETPNIDRLASAGVRFTAAFSAGANCAPSRASLMSGQYTPKHGVLYVGPGDYQEKWRKREGDIAKFKMIQPRGQTTLPADVETLGECLRQAGYQTAMFGKWHLGSKDQHPSRRGFGVAIESHGQHFAFKTDPPRDHPADQYLSDFLSDEAEQFIRKASALPKPFFLYYADFLVHMPPEAKQQYLDHFASKTPSENQKSPLAGAMIKSLDDSVGKIMAVLDELDERDNTLFVFTSDNGGLSYEEDGKRSENTSNRPLRGRKGSQYDGGIRVPWIVRWPAKTPPNVSCDAPVHQVDLFPTFVNVAGATAPQQELHGVDLTSVFVDPASDLTERNLYWYLPGYSAFHSPSVMVRRGRWKLIRSLESEATELYDTKSDVGESNELSPQRAELVHSLNQAALQWLDDLDAPRMTPNPEYSATLK